MDLLELALLLLSVYSLLVRGIQAADQRSEALTNVLEAEIAATKQQLELYQQKAELLSNAIQQIQCQQGHNASNFTGFGSGSPTALQRARYREHPQMFSDWFEPQGTFSPPKDQVLMQLVSFRPNASPAGRKQQLVARRKVNSDEDPPLQFLLVLDKASTVLSLFHPTTREIMWQHTLDLHSTADNEAVEVADMFFASDRSSHLAVLLTSGEVVLFKLRLWHGRRIISGDPRRLKPWKTLEENQLNCPIGQSSFKASDIFQPWLQSNDLLMSPSTGRYVYVDVERVFGATLDREWGYERGKVAVMPLHYRVFIVVSDNSGGHVSLFHGDNGSFIADVHTQVDSGVVQLEPIQNSRGLVALAARTRVVLMDTSSHRLVPVVCEAPGRHTFASVSADPLRPTIFYAGTSTGRALVYKLHNFGAWRQRSAINGPQQVTCTLVDQLMPRRLPQRAFGYEMATVVQTLPGCLVLGTGPRLALYQLSGSSEEVHPKYLSEHSLHDSFSGDEKISPIILGISSAKDLVVHSTGFATLVKDANGNFCLAIYESRIPPPGTNMDLSWMRVPAMMLCALAAMFWQQKGRLAYSAGGRSALNEAELAGLLNGRGNRLSGMGSMKSSGLTSNRRATEWY